MIRTLPIVACLFAVASPALGAPPAPDDYAQGMEISSPFGLPLVETTLPDAVYQTVTRADLGDIRVFNAEGRPVPHAFCTAPTASEPTITEHSLPVFELRDAPQVATGRLAHRGADSERHAGERARSRQQSAGRGERAHPHH